MELVQGCGFYGLFPYTPRIATIRQLAADDKLRQDSNFVYNFKKYGRNADRVKALIEAAADQLGCSGIVAVPGSTPKENNLQKLFGATIRRTAEVKSRKYNHTKELSGDYGESYQVVWGDVPAGRVLLVDDVCTSGATLRHFCGVFEAQGFEAVGLAVGLHYKKIGEPAEPGGAEKGSDAEWWFAGADIETIESLRTLDEVISICEVREGGIMGTRGRKPKPTELKLVEGNPGKRPINQDEPKPEAGRPDCPQHLSPDARKAWDSLLPLLEGANIVTKIDGMALETLCETYARWVDANDKLQKTGLIVKTSKGFPIQNPLIGIINGLFKQLTTMFAEFGLTPAERSRLKIGGGGKEADPFDEFLNN